MIIYLAFLHSILLQILVSFSVFSMLFCAQYVWLLYYLHIYIYIQNYFEIHIYIYIRGILYIYMYLYVDMCESTLRCAVFTCFTPHWYAAGGNYPGSGMEPCLNRVKKYLVNCGFPMDVHISYVYLGHSMTIFKSHSDSNHFVSGNWEGYSLTWLNYKNYFELDENAEWTSVASSHHH